MATGSKSGGNAGGIGSPLIKYLKEAYRESLEILALGTNAIATSQMMKARANRGATGENAIVHTVNDADLIIGPISVTWACINAVTFLLLFIRQLYYNYPDYIGLQAAWKSFSGGITNG